MQIANVKQRQIWFPRVGKIWVSTPQNLASGAREVGVRNPSHRFLKCPFIFGLYYKLTPMGHYRSTQPTYTLPFYYRTHVLLGILSFLRHSRLKIGL